MSTYQRLLLDPKSEDALSKYEMPDDLGFGKTILPIMAIAEYKNGSWGAAKLQPYGPLNLDPAARVLHYGQAIFEGMKAYNNEGKIALFRPEENHKRFNRSAERMAMPDIPFETFMNAIDSLCSYSEKFIPAGEGESLYLRPFMIASEAGLGLAAANEYLYMVVASPSGGYFAADKVNVLIERSACRAAPGGTGYAKAAGNYGGSIQAGNKAIKLGFQQTMWLDAVEKKYVEELSGMNIFAVVNNKIYTPKLTDSILEGITRDSVIKLARHKGYELEECTLDINWLVEKIKSEECSEIFAVGTAAVVTPLSSLGEADGTIYKIKEDFGPVAKLIKDNLVGIQRQSIEDPFSWVYEIGTNFS